MSNKLVLSEMREKLTKELPNEKPNDEFFVENLYKPTIDRDWFLAQCQSAYNQIDKILNENSSFHKKNPIYLIGDKLVLLGNIRPILKITGQWP